MDSSRYRSFLLLLFYLALFSLPLSVDLFSERWHLGLFLPAEPLMALTVGALGLGLLGGWVARPRVSTRLDKLIGFHFGAFGLATVFSSSLLVSGKYFATLILYAAFGYGLPRVLRLQRQEWQRTLLALALGTTVLALWALLRHCQLGVSYPISYLIAQPFLQHAHTNMTVLYEPLLLLLNLSLLYHPGLRARAPRLVLAAVFLVIVITVAFSYSRASYVSLMAQAMLLLTYVGWKNARRLLLLWLGCGVVVLGLWRLLDQVHPPERRINASAPSPTVLHELGSVSDFSSTNESNAERLSRWIFSLELWQEDPAIGVGPGTFPDRYLEFVRNAPNHPRYFTTMRRMNAHNLYLSWLVETGALGLLSGALLLSYLVGRQLRWTIRRRLSPGLLGLTIYFLFFLLHSTTQDFWQEPRVVVTFWLAVGLQRYFAHQLNSGATKASSALKAGVA